MKKTIFAVAFLLMFLPGCIGINHNVNKAPTAVNVWWGSKQEIIDFLNSPQAQANRWMVESIGE
jgi:PBP1b-binding outer membrane lipoprotein LpoB